MKGRGSWGCLVALAATLTLPGAGLAAERGPVRIGLPIPLTGGMASIGTDMRDGLLMAIEEAGGKEVDDFAYTSQMRANDAWEKGRLAEEVVPVHLKGKNGEGLRVERDEHLRPRTTPEGLATLKPVFKENGLVTAGNASGICDGAAALVVASADAAKARGWHPLGRMVAWAVVGVDPKLMGIGPAPAIRAALAKAHLQLGDMALVEVNEAFGAQYLAVEKELGLDRERVNVNGGAIALGHPLGASGARILLTLLCELRRRGERYGVGAACVGGGMGIAVIVEHLT